MIVVQILEGQDIIERMIGAGVFKMTGRIMA
jgi:hypothetical protein